MKNASRVAWLFLVFVGMHAVGSTVHPAGAGDRIVRARRDRREDGSSDERDHV